ncbi:hypothetical protein ACEPAF_7294 [Sanghuangporus sanghuang]
MNVVRLSPASPTADLRALQEVSDFAWTDMGWGGEDRWTYRKLTNEEVTQELHRIAHHGTNGNIDYVTFQPCTLYEARSQDRFVIQHWDFPDGHWTFSAIFDGHGSHGTVDYVVEHLPARVRSTLHGTLARGPASSATISHILSEAIIEVDHALMRDFQHLFPGGRDELARLSDNQIDAMTKTKTGTYSQSVLRCMEGSTALLTLMDPSGTHIWIANLGDCRAVLISRKPGGGCSARRVTEVHNGGNVHELQRIRNEHTGERECVVDDRVLGFLAPTRALGDAWMKLPAICSRRVLMRTNEFWARGISDEHINRLKTPPYVSNVPQVFHHKLRKSTRRSGHQRHSSQNSHSASGQGEEDVALLLCSDGLVDLYEDQELEEEYYLKRWAAMIGEVINNSNSSSSSSSISRSAPERNGSRWNTAVHVLRDAIGGDDLSRVSANLTVEMEERWIDDTTILVHKFT